MDFRKGNWNQLDLSDTFPGSVLGIFGGISIPISIRILPSEPILVAVFSHPGSLYLLLPLVP